MSITRINTNFDALFARQNLQKLEMQMNTSMARIASGSRINSAEDDPQAINLLKATEAQLSGNRVAQQNVQDAHAMFSYMDGIMSDVGDKLVAMRDIATRSATGTVGTTERTVLNQEFSSIKSEISNIFNLNWNGKTVFSGAAGTFLASTYVQIGANRGERIRLSAIAGRQDLSSIGNGTVNVSLRSAGTLTAAGVAISTLNQAITELAEQRSYVGNYMRSMSRMLSEQMNQEVNNAATIQSIGDADMAEEITNLTKAQVLAQSTIAIMGQANSSSQMILKLLM